MKNRRKMYKTIKWISHGVVVVILLVMLGFNSYQSAFYGQMENKYGYKSTKSWKAEDRERWEFATRGFLISGNLLFISVPGLLVFNTVVSLMQYSEGQKRKNYAKFYDECQKSGITSLNSEKNRKRAEILAKECNLPESLGIEQLYANAEAVALEETRKAEADARKAARASEQEKENQAYRRLNAHANLPGNEKTIAIILERIEELKKEQKEQRETMYYARRMLTQQEQNWAAAGGMVSGVAGNFAGALTALEIQQKNASIRAQNAKNAPAVALLSAGFQQNISQLGGDISALEAQLQKERRKLVAEMPVAEVFQHIKITNYDVALTELGSHYITATVSMPKALTIYGDVQANIDGTILAEVKQGDTVVGTANMVLPLYGVKPGSNVQVEGLVRNFSNKKWEGTCKVSFSAKSLFAIER